MLEMALVGYEVEKKKIEDRIREIRARLGGGRAAERVTRSTNNNQPAKRRRLSAAARKRIAAAQKKRWAEHRKALAQGSKE